MLLTFVMLAGAVSEMHARHTQSVALTEQSCPEGAIGMTSPLWT